MKTSRDLISIFIKLTACMQDGHNHFKSRDIAPFFNRFFVMFFNRDTPAIIFDGDRIIFMQDDIDRSAISRHCFVDTVVDDFVNELMQAIFAGIPDIHSRTFSNSLQPFQHGNRACIVFFFYILLIFCS